MTDLVKKDAKIEKFLTQVKETNYFRKQTKDDIEVKEIYLRYKNPVSCFIFYEVHFKTDLYKKWKIIYRE